MDAFPFRYSVGDLLGFGVPLEPEQEAVVTRPRLKAVTVIALPDPDISGNFSEGHHWADSETGGPILLPLVMDIKSPTDAEPFWTIEQGQRIQRYRPFAEDLVDHTLKDYGSNAEDFFEAPGGFGHATHMDPLHYYLPTVVADELHARKVWDCWAVDETEAREWESAVESAMHKAAFYELMDYLTWEEQGFEPESIGHFQHVEDRVLDDAGNLKPPPAFEPKLVLPKHLQYSWERLLDASRGGWGAWAQTHQTDQERLQVMRSAENPWS